MPNDEKKFLTAKDVSEILGVSRSSSYRLIQQLNDDLKKEGYITIAGKVSRRFFESKLSI